MRAVVDANVFVSALIKTSSAPGAVIDAWLDGSLRLVSSQPLLDELEDVLRRGRVRRHIDAPATRIAAILDRIRESVEFVEPAPGVAASRDPDDDVVLATAIAGEADVIVTGDHDLLSLGEYRGIPILSPADFVAALEAGPSE